MDDSMKAKMEALSGALVATGEGNSGEAHWLEIGFTACHDLMAGELADADIVNQALAKNNMDISDKLALATSALEIALEIPGVVFREHCKKGMKHDLVKALSKINQPEGESNES